MEILDHYGIDCTGKKAVVVGRSLVVGKPAAMMLIKKNATVTVCHTRTVDMPSVVKEADIVIVAAGRAGVVDDSYVRAGQVIIDVGINVLSLIHISEPTRRTPISYAVFCLKKKKKD